MTQQAQAGAKRPRISYTTKLTHPSFVIEQCPNPDCLFPEADGGFCPECGWTRYEPKCPHCRKEVR